MRLIAHENNDKNWVVFWLLLILFLSLLMRLPFLNVPMERDEGEYAYIAQRIQDGDIPYKDAVCQKPPLVFCIYLLIFKIMGKEISDIHLFTYLYTLLEVFLIYKLGQRLANKSVGLISALIFSIITIEPGVFGSAANTEIFMLLPIIGSIIVFLLAIKGPIKIKWLFVCGICNGLAFMIKQVAIFNLFFIISCLAYRFFKNKEKKEIRIFVTANLALLFGFVASLVPIILYFWANGAMKDFIYWVFVHNFYYIGNSFLDRSYLFTHWTGNVLKGDWFFWTFWLFPFAYLIKVNKGNGLMLIGWFVFSFFGVATGFRFWPHYFLQLAPAVALADGWGVWLLIGEIKFRNLLLKKSILIILLSLALISLSANYGYFLAYSPKQISRELYGRNPFVEAKTIANYLNENVSAKETVAILGSEPEILYYANRKSATKYIIFYPLMGNYKDARKNQREAVQEIINNKPGFIVAVNLIASLEIGPQTERYIFDEMHKLIESKYCLDSLVLIEKETTHYVFGQEQVKAFSRYLGSNQATIMIYRRKEA